MNYTEESTSLLSVPQQQQPADFQWHSTVHSPAEPRKGLSRGRHSDLQHLLRLGHWWWRCCNHTGKCLQSQQHILSGSGSCSEAEEKGQTMNGFLAQNKMTQQTFRLWAGGFSSHSHVNPVHLGSFGVLLFLSFHDNNPHFRLECHFCDAALVVQSRQCLAVYNCVPSIMIQVKYVAHSGLLCQGLLENISSQVLSLAHIAKWASVNTNEEISSRRLLSLGQHRQGNELPHAVSQDGVLL